METETGRLATALGRAGAGAALLSSFEDVCYATGFEVPPPIDAGAAFAFGPTLALVTADGGTTLLAPNAYAARVEEMSRADENVLVETFGHFDAVDAEHAFLAAVRSTVAALRGDVLALDRRTLPAAAAEVLEGFRTVDARPILRSARLIKTPHEIELLREAVVAADAGQEALRTLARTGRNELDVMGDVVTFVERTAGRPVPWAGELVTGPRTATLRYPGGPIDREIEPGDTVLMDLSVRNRGYWADCTNTLVAGAEPSDDQLRYFLAARAAFEAAADALRPGRRASDAFEAAAEALGQHGLEPAHYAGHGIGTAVNEEPRLVPYDHTPIEANMVFAVEPGAYAGSEGTTGARAERIVLVTESGPEVLSSFGWGMDG
ncbi:MAG: aminopeptidase P family protein [Actinobacteria bacterium]|nr:aminopeptidase P family protein [Actinomycetota bacterium]